MHSVNLNLPYHTLYRKSQIALPYCGPLVVLRRSTHGIFHFLHLLCTCIWRVGGRCFSFLTISSRLTFLSLSLVFLPPLPFLVLSPSCSNFFLITPPLLLLASPDMRLPDSRPQTRDEQRHSPFYWPYSLPQLLHPRILTCISLVYQALGHLLRGWHASRPAAVLLSLPLWLLSSPALCVGWTILLWRLWVALIVLRPVRLRLSRYLHNTIPPPPHNPTLAKQSHPHQPKPNADQ